MRCDLCGAKFPPTMRACPSCGNPLPRHAQTQRPSSPSSLPKTITPPNQNLVVLTILLLIFFYPFGIPFMWGMGVFRRSTRIWITLAFFVAILLGLTMILLWTAGPGSYPGGYA